jgi:predicted dinucleotide-binding enzyme
MRVGIYGAGKSGSAIARRALAAGLQVRIATSGPLERAAMITGIVIPGAVVTPIDELASQSDLLVVAVPLRRFHELPLEQFAGHIVIDAMNYWPPIDGVIPDFESGHRPSSVIVGNALPATARLVKSFNHIGYHQIEDLALPTGTEGRVAVGVSGDDIAAVNTVAAFVDQIGFDPVLTGSLHRSSLLEPESPVFGAHVPDDQFRRLMLTQLTSA